MATLAPAFQFDDRIAQAVHEVFPHAIWRTPADASAVVEQASAALSLPVALSTEGGRLQISPLDQVSRAAFTAASRSGSFRLAYGGQASPGQVGGQPVELPWDSDLGRAIQEIYPAAAQARTTLQQAQVLTEVMKHLNLVGTFRLQDGRLTFTGLDQVSRAAFTAASRSGSFPR